MRKALASGRASAPAMLLALLLVLSAVAPVLALAVGPVNATPGGMVGVPDSNVRDRIPDHARASNGGPIPIGEQWRGDVMASSHAESLSLTVTTRSKLEGRENVCVGQQPPPFCTNPELALVFTDDSNHEGRTVSVGRADLVDALGRVPELAYVEHSSGERYTVPVKQQNGLLTWDLKEFSSNTVTFSSEVTLTGNPATDGTQFQYNVSDLDAVQNYTINVTGSTASAWDNESAGALANGDTMGLSVAGNLAPTGPSAAGEPVIEFTGRRNETWQNESHVGVYPSASHSLNLSGNDVSGPATGDPRLTITNAHDQPVNGLFSTRDIDKKLNANNSLSAEFPNPPEQVTEVRLHTSGKGTSGATYNIRIAPGEADATYGEGTLVASNVSFPGNAWANVTLDTPYDVSSSKVEVEYISQDSLSNGYYVDEFVGEVGLYEGSTSGNHAVEMVLVDSAPTQLNATASDGTKVSFGTPSAGDTAAIPFSPRTSALNWSATGGGSFDYDLEVKDISTSTNLTFDLDNDGTTEASHTGTLSDGATATYELGGLSTTSSSAAVGMDEGGSADVAIKFKERTETDSPSVEVNGNTTSHTGTLADGKTVSLSTNTSWVKEGLNQVNVSAADPSADAPTPEVGLDYSHGAVSNKTVTYTGETWSERYNVSKTFASDRSSAALTVPFASSRVIGVRGVEKRVNGGSWQAVDSSAQSFDGTELTAELGAVSAGDTVEVRANGSKVVVSEGNITVEQPTTEGNKLDSRIRFDSWAKSSHIAVGGTASGDRVHYLYNESYPDAAEYAAVTAGGKQHLYAPNANTGGTAQVRTLPLQATPDNDVEVLVESTGYEPQFKVRPGSTTGDSVEWQWSHEELVSGRKYLLMSVSTGKQVDSDVSESPVWFTSGDGEQTFEILEDNTTSTGDGGGGGFYGDAEDGLRQFAPVLDPELIAIIVLALLVAGVAYSESRGERTKPLYARPSVWVAGGAALVLALLFLAPGVLARPVETMLSATLPLLGLGAVAVLVILAAGWYRARKNSSKPPTLEVIARQK